MKRPLWKRWWVVVLVVAHLAGAASTLPALMSTRTPQGTVAWIVSLNTLPVLAVPAYWLFGRSRFEGYVENRRVGNAEVEDVLAGDLEALLRRADRPFDSLSRGDPDPDRALEHLAPLPFFGSHAVELLIDGHDTFDHMLEGIASAQTHVLAQFFIFRDDALGRRVGEALAERARAGVEAYLLYDAVGSPDLSKEFIGGLRTAGVNVAPFESAKGSRGMRQYQLRNHRKSVVVDGVRAWIGGHNVGVEYLGEDPERGPWRDTHLAITGAAALALQLAFVQDWRWATDETIDLNWDPPASPSGARRVMIVPSGPADEVETASLMLQHLIHSAERRVWVATPYFVPDAGVMDALRMAALRGVQLQILLPEQSDSFLVDQASFVYLSDLLELGATIHRYEAGFMHQKVVLVDDRVAAIGTVNVDNRSLRLNFEATALVLGAEFAGEVESMLSADFADSRRLERGEIDARPWHLEVASRIALLAAPIL
ncbi:cardiolipin synthase [Gemmatimonadota bacterium Y43]|uniref:cardiolipin synthase n=1 Tax=Gaopeijia maritima TaxID=3119007 RepID=UPI0032715E92